MSVVGVALLGGIRPALLATGVFFLTVDYPYVAAQWRFVQRILASAWLSARTPRPLERSSPYRHPCVTDPESARGGPPAGNALEEIRSGIGAAAYRDAVIGLEQGWISRSWQPDAMTSAGGPGLTQDSACSG